MSRVLGCLLGLLAWASVASAGPPEGPVEGFVIRGEFGAAPLLTHHMAEGPGNPGSESPPQRYRMETTTFQWGGRAGVDLGYAVGPKWRFGLHGTWALTWTMDQDYGLAYTDVSGFLLYSIGPTVGYRLGPAIPIEVEFEIALLEQKMLGSQLHIGAPDNIYPFGADHFGLYTGARCIWRPLGPRSLLGVSSGLGGWWSEGTASVESRSFALSGELSLLVGY